MLAIHVSKMYGIIKTKLWEFPPALYSYALMFNNTTRKYKPISR